MGERIFSRKYLIVNEILNAITHGIGAILSIVGLVFLIFKGIDMGSNLSIAAYAIYGGMLILLFLSSTLFHSLIFTKAKKVFQVFDHSSIYLLIAGSYTPFCLLSIKGHMGWTLCILIWLLAVGGIVYKALTLYKQKKVSNASTVLYIIMGWLCVIAAEPLCKALGLYGTILLVAGGVAYTVGTIFYSLKKVKFMHVVWHLFVMLGAGLMYFSILFYT